jgi:hypothetical protein
MGASYGFDTDNFIYNVAASARSKFGTGSFYVRYFNPSPGATHLITSSSGVAETRSGWDNGAIYLVPNSEPAQSRLNGSNAMGVADANAFCAAIFSIYVNVGPLLLPSTNRVDVYLSLESATNLSNAYWTGWASVIDAYELGGGAPLYPGMYCNPGSPAKNCSTAIGYYCWSVWSSEPEPCAACGPFGSVGWNAENCFNVGSGAINTTLAWQMVEQNVCTSTCGRGSYPNVDADMTNPSYSEATHMFYLASRP